MVSERAFATEVADVEQAEVAPEFVGEEGELNEVQASITAADADEDDNVDLAAVLGGNIRKAPAAASVDEPETAIADDRSLSPQRQAALCRAVTVIWFHRGRGK